MTRLPGTGTAPMSVPPSLEEFDRRTAAAANENREFRTFLKGCEISPRQMDLLVRRHYEEVAREIDCTTCGRCCQRLTPLLLAADVRRLARALGLSEAGFRARHAEATEEGKDGGAGLNLKGPPCPFLAKKKCTVYEQRPADCRSYPHLHKKDFVFRLVRVVEDAAICPIVHFVLDRLKTKLWGDRRIPGI